LDWAHEDPAFIACGLSGGVAQFAHERVVNVGESGQIG